MGIAELTQESLALHEMVASSGGDPGESIEKMSMLLKKIKDFMQTENPDMDAPTREKSVPANCSGHTSTDKNHKVPVIPDDFRCPISLELMKDPVIVSTGQVIMCLLYYSQHQLQYNFSLPFIFLILVTTPWLEERHHVLVENCWCIKIGFVTLHVVVRLMNLK